MAEKITNKPHRKYSCEQIYERMDNGLCLFCEELDTPGHYHLKHKSSQIFMTECDDLQISDDNKLVEPVVDLFREANHAKIVTEEKLPLGENNEHLECKQSQVVSTEIRSILSFSKMIMPISDRVCTEEGRSYCLSQDDRVWEPGGLPTGCDWSEKYRNHDGGVLKLISKLHGTCLQNTVEKFIHPAKETLDWILNEKFNLEVSSDLDLQAWTRLEIGGCKFRRKMLLLVKESNHVWERGGLLADKKVSDMNSLFEATEAVMQSSRPVPVACLRQLVLSDMESHRRYKCSLCVYIKRMEFSWFKKLHKISVLTSLQKNPEMVILMEKKTQDCRMNAELTIQRIAQEEEIVGGLTIYEVAETLEKLKSFKTTKCAYRLFDKNVQKGRREKQQSMQRKVPKSWKFKFKSMSEAYKLTGLLDIDCCFYGNGFCNYTHGDSFVRVKLHTGVINLLILLLGHIMRSKSTRHLPYQVIAAQDMLVTEYYLLVESELVEAEVTIMNMWLSKLGGKMITCFDANEVTWKHWLVMGSNLPLDHWVDWRELIRWEELCLLQNDVCMLLVVRNELQQSKLCLWDPNGQAGAVLDENHKRSKEDRNDKATMMVRINHSKYNVFGVIRYKLVWLRETSKERYEEDSWSFIRISLKEDSADWFDRERETIKKSFEGPIKHEKNYKLLSIGSLTKEQHSSLWRHLIRSDIFPCNVMTIQVMVLSQWESVMMMLISIAERLTLLGYTHMLVAETNVIEISISRCYGSHSCLGFPGDVRAGTFMDEFSSVCKLLLGAFALNLLAEQIRDCDFFGLFDHWKWHPPEHFYKSFNGKYSVCHL